MRCEFWFHFRIAFAIFRIFCFSALFFAHFAHFFALLTTFWCLNCKRNDQKGEKVRKGEKCVMRMRNPNAVWCNAMSFEKKSKYECDAKKFSHYHPCVMPLCSLFLIFLTTFSFWGRLLQCPACQWHGVSSRPVTKLISKAHKQQIFLVSQIKTLLYLADHETKNRISFSWQKKAPWGLCFREDSKALIEINVLCKFFLNWHQGQRWKPILPHLVDCLSVLITPA